MDYADVQFTGLAARSTKTNGTNFYAFIDLPPGTYTVNQQVNGSVQAAALSDSQISLTWNAVTGPNPYYLHIRGCRPGGGPVPALGLRPVLPRRDRAAGPERDR